MNKYSDRGNAHSMVPATPNIEQYKIHSKTKPKKKHAPSSTPIQPTLQPNIYHSPKVSTPSCILHPDKKATIFEKNSKRGYCNKCAAIHGFDDSNFYDEERKIEFI